MILLKEYLNNYVIIQLIVIYENINFDQLEYKIINNK